jgi:ATP-dependent helicase/nuclease subunit A
VLRLGAALLALYGAAKEARALLDYDDLIARSGALLRRPGVGPWVLYKLDGGIDHILVDEAQDTAPDQWQVVAALADEFFAGQGARDQARTVFAVGDEKQSIFSFQGADLRSYAAMRERFARRVRDAGQSWRDLPLTLSRRSVPAVLGLVDQVFATPEARDGVVGEGQAVAHEAVRQLPGVVEIWPQVRKAGSDIADAWEVPADYTAPQSPAATLAFRLASTVRDWLDRGEILAATGRPIAPGDVMILVRRRNEFFEAMVRALKARAVPVAGADRLVLAEHIAAMDLVALGQFALLPEDDLNLATVLKGPLFGFDDDDLFQLCWQRRQRLWPTLRSRAHERPRWIAAAAELERLLARADFVPPFEFYAEVLGAGRGRQRILGRLGPEAADPIDEFLNLALAHEQGEAPTLQNFLHWFAQGEVEIKRDLEQETDAVRVMTVHAAKGRESAIVILPDTGPIRLYHHDPKLLWGGLSQRDRPPLLWPVRGTKDIDAVVQGRDAERLARAQENRRLLYVALTRARDRLIVCGYVNRPPPDPDKAQADEGDGDASWYDLVGAAFSRLPAVEEVPLPWSADTSDTARLWRGPPVSGKVPLPVPQPSLAAMPPLPSWVGTAPPLDPTPPRPLSPSRPPGPEPAPPSPVGATDSFNARRGRILHRLLQVLPDLPVERREAVMGRYLSGADLRLTVPQRAEIAAQVNALMTTPHLAGIFAPGALSEAPLVGRLGDHVVAGQMDRLLVGASEILVVDYKSGRAPPTGFHPAYVRQMALYRALLGQIYPGRAIRCALLWTETALVEELPEEMLEDTVLV